MNDPIAHPGYAAWLQQVSKDLKGADFREKLVHTRQEVEVQPLYTRDQLPVFDADPNAEFLEDLDPELAAAMRGEGQQHMTWIPVEDCTMDAGTDLDLAIARMRNRGVADARIRVATEGDWDHVISGIRTLSTPSHFHFDVTGPLDEHTVDAWRERLGLLGDRDRLVQAVEFDPLSHWLKTGYPADTGVQYQRLAEAFFRISAHLQDCRLLKVDVADVCASGGSAVDELTAALQRTATYFDALESRKVPLHELMHLITFRFGLGTDYFFEIAKLRAWKVLWKNLILAYMPDVDMIPEPYIHAVISTRTFTTEDKHSNLLRSTTSAMSAILGGADALTIPAFDVETPQEESAIRLAANVHQLLRYESYMDRYRDAANGSYFIEQLTHTLGRDAWSRFVQTYKS